MNSQSDTPTTNGAMEKQVKLWGLAERSFSGKSLIHIGELSKDELTGLLRCARDLKAAFGKDSSCGGNESNSESNKSKFCLAAKSQPLLGRSMAMIFMKRSTRTRVSTETGFSMLGGHALFLGPTDIQLNVNETLHDTAQVLSKFNSIVLARVFSHDDVKVLRDSGSVPVINALSDLHHPLQTLADLMTLQEQFGDLKGRTITWIGDGCNVLHDLMLGCALLGVNVKLCIPPGYEPYQGVLSMAQKLASKSGSRIMMFNEPSEAVHGASAIFTDTWISMGQESEAYARKQAFHGYQVTQELMSKAKSDAVFMHCLPRHQEEVTDEVFYGKQSVVFPEAENRMWTVMSVALSILS